MQLFHKSEIILVIISEKPSTISGTSFSSPSREVFVCSTKSAMADDPATIDSIAAPLIVSKMVEIMVPITSTISTSTYSNTDLIASAACSIIPLVASPGTLNAWIKTTKK
uniref:Uncharacterized protein n=1 Tax=Opuntia streptacantha TaxID=393608 RepID=A0A7C9EP80_OPUST